MRGLIQRDPAFDVGKYEAVEMPTESPHHAGKQEAKPRGRFLKKEKIVALLTVAVAFSFLLAASFMPTAPVPKAAQSVESESLPLRSSTGSSLRSLTAVTIEDETKEEQLASNHSDFRFNVQLPEFGEHVMDGYSNCNKFVSDVSIALKILADNTIESGNITCYYGGNDDDDEANKDDADGDDDEANKDDVDGEDAADDDSSGDFRGGFSPVKQKEDSFDTNVQVEGVDEADTIKSDGNHIFAVYGNQIIVTDSNGSVLERTSVPQSNEPKQQNRSIKGLLLNDGILTVLTEFFKRDCDDESPVCGPVTTTFLYTFVGGTNNLTLTRQFDINGRYSNARGIDGDNHIITQVHPNTWRFTDKLNRCRKQFRNMSYDQYKEAAFNIANSTVDEYAQMIVDGLDLPRKGNVFGGSEGSTVSSSCENIVQLFNSTKGHVNASTTPLIFSYRRDESLQTFFQVASINVKNASEEGSTVSYNVAGAFIPSYNPEMYASKKNLVLAGDGYRVINVVNDDDENDGIATVGRVAMQYTYLMSFDLNDSQATPNSVGEVNGRLNNQFSMDYYYDADGLVPPSLRVATSSFRKWALFALDDGHYEWKMIADSMSQVTILQEEGNRLLVVGSADDLGTGEAIQSVRFLGIRGYVSTYRNKDTVYVLDLSEPTSPQVTGQLNVTGYPKYMHPVKDGQFLLTVGRETADNGWMNMGIKISLFNVTDPTSPFEQQKYVVEGEGSSEALNDHHAFRYLPGNEKLIIPAYVFNWRNPKQMFDGAWVFDIDVENGISPVREGVSHADVHNMTCWYCWDRAKLPSRSMVFGDNLLTFKSHSIIMTKDVNTLNETLWELNLDDGRNETANDDCAPYSFW